MRVLAHIHTMNDAAVIEQLLDALRHQTRPPDAIIIVDNASTDATLDKACSEGATIVRNCKNLGPSGAIRTGFEHALEHGFDWTWVLDADTVPEADALEKLLAFFEHLPPAQREQVCFLNGWPLNETGGIKLHPTSLERGRMRALPLVRVREFTQCDFTMWSGCLFRMATVAKTGLPTADYVADMGEAEYGYRARQLGFTSYIVHSAVIHHDVGRDPGVAQRLYHYGPIRLSLYETSPWRAYYSVRNMIYFWLYQYEPGGMAPPLRGIVRSLATTLNFLVRPVSHRRHLIACIRGIRDGLTRHMERRY